MWHLCERKAAIPALQRRPSWWVDVVTRGSSVVYVRGVQQKCICCWMRAVVTQRCRHMLPSSDTSEECWPRGPAAAVQSQSAASSPPPALLHPPCLSSCNPSFTPCWPRTCLAAGCPVWLQIDRLQHQRPLSSSAMGQMLPDKGHLVFFQRHGTEL